MARLRDTVSEAHGRWREVLPALGIPTSVLSGHHQPCPMCGGNDRFRFTDRNKKGDYFCSGCGAGIGIKLLMEYNGWDFKRAVDEIDKIIGGLPPASAAEFSMTRAAHPGTCRRLYSESFPIIDSDATGKYLTKRGLHLSPWSKALRHIPELRHKASGTVQHGMLAVFSTAEGKAATIHRTFLTKAGNKADVDPVRMFMPGDVPNGGAIRLSDAAETMGVAEGIETALAASILYRMPVWAVTSELLLSRWQPPAIAKRISIFGDNDANYVGQCASYVLAKRLMFEAKKEKIERTVEVHIPSVVSFDWNDVLIERSKVTSE